MDVTFMLPGTNVPVEVQNLYVLGIVAIIGALYYGTVAARKGRNFLLWAVLGAIGMNVGLLATAGMTAYSKYLEIVGDTGIGLQKIGIVAIFVVLIGGSVILPLWGDAKPKTARR